MDKIKNIVLIVIMLLIFSNVKAQENKFKLWSSYVVGPSVISLQSIYRVDSFFERYEDGTAQGFGFGFSVPLFSVFSPVVNIDFISRNGIDTHGTLNNRVKFSGSRVQLGGAIHLKREQSPFLDLNIGVIRNKYNITNNPASADNNKTGFGKGVYLGPSMMIGITKASAIRFGSTITINVTDFEDNPNYDGSGEISQFVALNIEFNISYVFLF